MEHEGEEEEGVGGVAAAGEGLEEGVPEGEVGVVGEEEGEEAGVVGGEGGDDAAGGAVVVVGGMGWKSSLRGWEWGRRWVEEEAKLHGCWLECAITVASAIIYL